jgi:hypothetical protein
LVCDDGGIFLGWLRNLLPAMWQCVGNLHGAMQMNDEDDSGGGFFVDMIKTIIAIFFFVLFMSVVASIVWGLIA